jgi:hypothetical protein
MPSWRYGSFKVVIRTNEAEFEPPHVHVFLKGDGQIKINLGSGEQAEIHKIWEMRDGDAAAAWDIVNQRRAYFLDRWREIHGEVGYKQEAKRRDSKGKGKSKRSGRK